LNPSPVPDTSNAVEMEIFNSMLPCVEYLILNISEAELLGSIQPGTIQTAINKNIQTAKHHLDTVCDYLFSRNVSYVIITLGPKGVYLKSQSRVDILSSGVYFPSLKAKVVDTTGAGDTFLGAFAASLAMQADRKPHTSGEAILEAIKYARHAAAMAVEKHGAQSAIPTAAELQADRESNKERGLEQEALYG
jgi:ribokinase